MESPPVFVAIDLELLTREGQYEDHGGWIRIIKPILRLERPGRCWPHNFHSFETLIYLGFDLQPAVCLWGTWQSAPVKVCDFSEREDPYTFFWYIQQHIRSRYGESTESKDAWVRVMTRCGIRQSCH